MGSDIELDRKYSDLSKIYRRAIIVKDYISALEANERMIAIVRNDRRALVRGMREGHYYQEGWRAHKLFAKMILGSLMKTARKELNDRMQLSEKLRCLINSSNQKDTREDA